MSTTKMYKVEMTEAEFGEWVATHTNRKAEKAFSYNPEAAKKQRATAKAKHDEMVAEYARMKQQLAK